MIFCRLASITWRRVFVCALMAVGFWVLVFTWTQNQIKQLHLQILLNGLEHQVRMTEVLYSLRGPDWSSEIEAFRQRLPYQVSIIDGQGRIVADSLFPPPALKALDNQLSQKEIQQAAEKGVGSDLRYNPHTDGWFLYAAVPLSTGEGFIRLSRPVTGPNPRPESP